MYAAQTKNGFSKTIKDSNGNEYSEFIFYDKNKMPIRRHNFDQRLNFIVEKYNKLNPLSPLPHIHPHMIRHTFTTIAIRKGLDPKTVSVMLGHSNVSMTLNVYTDIQEKDKRNEYNEVSEYLQELLA